MPKEHYVVKVGDHNEEILGEDILAILEAAFDDALESQINILDKLAEIGDDI
jgi:hypothetical protein